jgi:hypothetical protein
MSRPSRLKLDKLVGQIVLDLNLAKWFATHGRRQEILDIITLLRVRTEDRPALDAIERFIE